MPDTIRQGEAPGLASVLDELRGSWTGMRPVDRDLFTATVRRRAEKNGVTVRELGWDLSDPATPTAVRKCRGCGVELRYPFPGGVVPMLLQFVGRVCEACGEKEELEEQRAANAAERVKRVRASGIPLALQQATWDTLWPQGRDEDETAKRERAIERARTWAEQSRPEHGLFLWGDAGSGKTWLAAAAAMARLQHSPIRWVSVAVLVAQLDGAWDDDERKRALKVLTEPGTAVLDDFGKAAPTGRARSQLFAALDRRSQAKTTLLVTSNQSLKDLEKDWSDPVVSRLVQLCGTPLRYPGPDRRIELAKGAT